MDDDTFPGELRGHELGFFYCLRRASKAPAETLILLHGSGADETTMLPLGTEIAPEAALIAVRGRILQDGSRRWFTRISPISFHQKSIRAEASAFARFLQELAGAERFDPQQAIFIGYSNGANLLTSVMLLMPGVIRRAVLLRPMPVLSRPPDTDLTDTNILIIRGVNDETYGRFASPLASMLRKRNAVVETADVPTGHEFGPLDVERIRMWLSSAVTPSRIVSH